MSCISSSSVSILVNGDHTDYFKPPRGIRQGDPISPYIFILCMEMLSRKIEEEIRNKTWYPIKISKKGPKMSHLFFANDIILMNTANYRNVECIHSLIVFLQTIKTNYKLFQIKNVCLKKLCERTGN